MHIFYFNLRCRHSCHHGYYFVSQTYDSHCYDLFPKRSKDFKYFIKKNLCFILSESNHQIQIFNIWTYTLFIPDHLSGCYYHEDCAGIYLRRPIQFNQSMFFPFNFLLFTIDDHTLNDCCMYLQYNHIYTDDSNSPREKETIVTRSSWRCMAKYTHM